MRKNKRNKIHTAIRLPQELKDTYEKLGEKHERSCSAEMRFALAIYPELIRKGKLQAVMRLIDG